MVIVVPLSNFLESVGSLALFMFILSSMVGMGLSYSIKEIIEPLKNLKLDLRSIIANFVVIPLFTLVIILILPLSTDLRIGLILIGFAAGGPFIPKLIEVAKGNFPYAIGLMIILVVGTIIYLPLVLPLVIQGVMVDVWSVANSLIFLMLVPLILSMLFKYRYPNISKELKDFFLKVSNLSIFVLFIAFFIVYWPDTSSMIGSYGIIASIIIVIGMFIIGYLFGGKDDHVQRTLAINGTQRNLSAALAVAALNFNSSTIIAIIMLFGFIAYLLSTILGIELGRTARHEEVED